MINLQNNETTQKHLFLLKKHQIIGCGGQSIVLEDGHHAALLVTTSKVAQHIFTLSDSFSDAEAATTRGFEIPKLIATNVNLTQLIDHDSSGGLVGDELSNIQLTKKWETNFVFRIKRYHGDLSKPAYSFKYTIRLIKILDTTIRKALEQLHKKQLTHNDVALRNILYKGAAPRHTFSLCDFGSVTKNKSPKTHAIRANHDLRQLDRVIERLKVTLRRKNKFLLAKRSQKTK